MDCRLIQPELVLYHFGTIEPSARESVERHLLACRTCLEGFLALKRHLESDHAGPRPSASVRERLRASVEREFVRPHPARAAWRRAASWGVAAAAAAALLVTASWLGAPRSTPGRPPDAGLRVDSPRPSDARLELL